MSEARRNRLTRATHTLVGLAAAMALFGAASGAQAGSGGIGTGGGSGPIVDDGTLNWLTQTASWYGPGFYGNQTACGQKFTKRIVGVAHKTLPCGTKVVFEYEGRQLRTKVIDRGPFISGRSWDLSAAAAKRLAFEGVDEVRVAKLSQGKGGRSK